MISDLIANGRIILAPWLAQVCVFEVYPPPHQSGAKFEDSLRAIFPSITRKGIPNENCYIITSDADRVLLALLERV